MAAGACFAVLFAVVPATAQNKPFSAVVAPGTVPAGSTVTMRATLTNEASPQDLGSANLFWPSGFDVTGASFDVTGASVPSGSAAVAANCTLSGATAGPCVQLRDLSLAPGASTTVMLTARTASPCSGYAWRIEAKQANDFKGAGNDFDLDSANSILSTQVSSPCAIALAFQTQPHTAFIGDPLTGLDKNPSGPPVSAEVMADTGNVLTTSNAPITVGLGDNPTGAILSGTKTVNASGGVATFGDLSVDTAGDRYTLTASSPGLTGATSSPFSVATPPPLYGKTANVEPVGGVVCVRLRGQTNFHRLAGLEQIPVGSIIDASGGKAKLFSAKTRDSSELQHGVFSRGPFEVTQSKNGRAFTKLTLLGFTSSCGQQPAAATRAGAIYEGHKHCRHHKRRCKRLYGSGSGSYRTSGDGGSGSTIGRRVPGGFQVPVASTGSRRTKWLTANRRKGTYFRVDRGTLVVRDFSRHRKVRLHAGQHYLARFNP